MYISILGLLMRKRKRKVPHKIPSKIVYISPRANTVENLSEKNFNSQNSLESEETYKGLLESAQRMLKNHQELLGLCRCSALKHATWESSDFEKDLAEIKSYLSKIEQDKKRIESSNNLVQFMRKLESVAPHKNNH